jgi:hypothetical protein
VLESIRSTFARAVRDRRAARYSELM